MNLLHNKNTLIFSRRGKDSFAGKKMSGEEFEIKTERIFIVED